MKILEYELNKSLYIPDYLSESETICFLDIETDGLSHSYNKVILVGLFKINLKSGSQSIVQLFSESSSEEAILLNKLTELLSDIGTVFTYNGASFDFPFLKKRFQFNRIEHSLDSLHHIDLMKEIRKNKQELSLPDCKLKTVEKKLGIQRIDTISGRESVLLYKEYLKNKSVALEKTILKHNYEDIFYLPDLLKVEKLLSHDNSIVLSVNSKKIKLNFDPKKLKISKSKLKASLSAPSLNVPNYMVFEDIYSFRWDAFSGKLDLEFFIESSVNDSSQEIRFLDVSDSSLSEFYSENIISLYIDGETLYANILRLIEHVIKQHL